MKTASVCLAVPQSWHGLEQGVQMCRKWFPVFWVTDDGLPDSVIARGNYPLPLHSIVTFESVLTMKGLAPEITRGQGNRQCSVDGISQTGIKARDCRGLSWPTPDQSLFPQTFPVGRVIAFGLWAKRTSLNFGAGEKLNALVSLRDWTFDWPSVRLHEGQ